MLHVLQQFILGLRAPWKGLRFLRQNKDYWPTLVIPLCISILLFFMFVLTLIKLSPDYINNFLNLIENKSDAFWPDILNFKLFFWIGNFFLFIIRIIVYALTFSFSFVLAWLISNVLCSFFWEKLAEKTLAKSALFNNSLPLAFTFKNISISMIRELFKEALLFLLVAVFWILTWIPIAGQSLFIFVLPILTSICLGFVQVDYAFSVMGTPIKKRFAWAKQHTPYLLGLGIYALIFPVVYFLYPAFIVGALNDQNNSVIQMHQA